MNRSQWPGLSAAAAAFLAAVLIGGCGSGDSGTTSTEVAPDGDPILPLTVYSDSDETGDPQLGPNRIRITPKGLWTSVYSVPLKDLITGEVVLAGVDIQMTNCRPSDLAPGSTSSCQGTVSYDLNPEIDAKLVLSGAGKNGKATVNGAVIGAPDKLRCTAKLHHCVTAQFGKADVGKDQTGNRFVTLFVRATDPGAKPCKPAVPAKCNVLQLTHGQGRLGVARERHPDLEPPAKVVTKERVTSLPLAKDKSEKQNDTKVVYSIPLDKVGPVLVRAELLAEFGLDYPTPPLVNKSLILANSPTSTNGKTVEPQNGENCEGKCHYTQLGLIPCVTQEDLDAGNKFLNLVVFTSRSSAFAKPKDEVKVTDGGYLGIRQYDASLAPKACATSGSG
jgi:hypothetical protein